MSENQFNQRKDSSLNKESVWASFDGGFINLDNQKIPPEYKFSNPSNLISPNLDEVTDSNEIVDEYLSSEYDENFHKYYSLGDPYNIGRTSSEALTETGAEEPSRPRFGSATHQPMEGIPEEPDEMLSPTATRNSFPQPLDDKHLLTYSDKKPHPKIARKSILASLKEKESAPLPPLPPEAYQKKPSAQPLFQNEHQHSSQFCDSKNDNSTKQEFRQPTIRKRPNFKSSQIASAYALFSRFESSGSSALDPNKRSFKKKRLSFLNRKANKHHEGVSIQPKIETQDFNHSDDMSSMSLHSVPLLKRNESIKQTTLKLQKQLESLAPSQIYTAPQKIGKVARIQSRRRPSAASQQNNLENKQVYECDDKYNSNTSIFSLKSKSRFPSHEQSLNDISDHSYQQNQSSTLESTPESNKNIPNGMNLMDVNNRLSQIGEDEEDSAQIAIEKNRIFSKEQELTDLVETLKRFHKTLDQVELDAKNGNASNNLKRLSDFNKNQFVFSPRDNFTHERSPSGDFNTKNIERQKRFQRKQKRAHTPPESPRSEPIAPIQYNNYRNMGWAQNWLGLVQSGLEPYLKGFPQSSVTSLNLLKGPQSSVTSLNISKGPQSSVTSLHLNKKYQSSAASLNLNKPETSDAFDSEDPTINHPIGDIKQYQIPQPFYEKIENPSLPQSLNELNEAYKQLLSFIKEKDDNFSDDEDFVTDTQDIQDFESSSDEGKGIETKTIWQPQQNYFPKKEDVLLHNEKPLDSLVFKQISQPSTLHKAHAGLATSEKSHGPKPVHASRQNALVDPPPEEYLSSNGSNGLKSIPASPSWTLSTSPINYNESTQVLNQQEQKQYHEQLKHEQQHEEQNQNEHGFVGSQSQYTNNTESLKGSTFSAEDISGDYSDISRHRRQRSSLEYEGSITTGTESTERDSVSEGYSDYYYNNSQLYVGMVNGGDSFVGKVHDEKNENPKVSDMIKKKQLEKPRVSITVTSPNMETFELIESEKNKLLKMHHANGVPVKIQQNISIYTATLPTNSVNSLSISTMNAASSSVLSLNTTKIFSSPILNSSMRSLHFPFENKFRESMKNRKKSKPQNTVQFASPLCQEISALGGEGKIEEISSDDDGVETASITSEESFGHVFGGPGVPPYQILQRQQQHQQQQLQYYELLKQQQELLQETLQKQMQNGYNGAYEKIATESGNMGEEFFVSRDKGYQPTNDNYTEFTGILNLPTNPQSHSKADGEPYFDSDNDTEWMVMDPNNYISSQNTNEGNMGGISSPSNHPIDPNVMQETFYEQHEFNELQQENPYSVYHNSIKQHPYHSLADGGTGEYEAKLQPNDENKFNSRGNLPISGVGGMTAVTFGGDSGGDSGNEVDEFKVAPQFTFPALNKDARKSRGRGNISSKLGSISSTITNYQQRQRKQQQSEKQSKQQNDFQEEQRSQITSQAPSQQPAPHPSPIPPYISNQTKINSDGIFSSDSTLSIFGQYAETVGGGVNGISANFKNLNLDFVEEDELSRMSKVQKTESNNSPGANSEGLKALDRDRFNSTEHESPHIPKRMGNARNASSNTAEDNSVQSPNGTVSAKVNQLGSVEPGNLDPTFMDYESLPVASRPAPAPPNQTYLQPQTQNFVNAPYGEVKSQQSIGDMSIPGPVTVSKATPNPVAPLPTPTRSKMQTIPPAMAMTPALSPTSMIPIMDQSTAQASQDPDLGEGFGFVFRMSSPSPPGPEISTEYVGYMGQPLTHTTGRSTLRPVPLENAFGNFASTDEEDDYSEGGVSRRIPGLMNRRRRRRRRRQDSKNNKDSDRGKDMGRGASKSNLLGQWWNRDGEGSDSDENDERFLPTSNMVLLYIKQIKELIKTLLAKIEEKLLDLKERNKSLASKVKTGIVRRQGPRSLDGQGETYRYEYMMGPNEQTGQNRFPRLQHHVSFSNEVPSNTR